jgi:lysophospholipase L1-like esterase
MKPIFAMAASLIALAALGAAHSADAPLDGGIVFVGDSLTEGGRWAEYYPGLRVTNLGIGGDRSETLLKRASQVTTLRPGKIFLLIGTNDLYRKHSAATIVANVTKMLTLWREQLPGVRIYVQSVLPREPQFAASIRELNTELRAMAQRERATFVDLYPVFVVEGERLDPRVTSDDVHLTEAGYERWRRAIAECVETDC